MAQNLEVTSDLRSQLVKAGAAYHKLKVSDYTGLTSGVTYYAYDPTTATYWAGAQLVPGTTELAHVYSQDAGSYLLFGRRADTAWKVVGEGGNGGYDGETCSIVPASVVGVWNWPSHACNPWGPDERRPGDAPATGSPTAP